MWDGSEFQVWAVTEKVCLASTVERPAAGRRMTACRVRVVESASVGLNHPENRRIWCCCAIISNFDKLPSRQFVSRAILRRRVGDAVYQVAALYSVSCSLQRGRSSNQSNPLHFVHLVLLLLCLRPHRAEALSNAFVWRPSVACTGPPNSRTERPRNTKIGTEVVHVTRDSDTTSKVKRSKVNLLLMS